MAGKPNRRPNRHTTDREPHGRAGGTPRPAIWATRRAPCGSETPSRGNGTQRTERDAQRSRPSRPVQQQGREQKRSGGSLQEVLQGHRQQMRLAALSDRTAGRATAEAGPPSRKATPPREEYKRNPKESTVAAAAVDHDAVSDAELRTAELRAGRRNRQAEKEAATRRGSGPPNARNGAAARSRNRHEPEPVGTGSGTLETGTKMATAKGVASKALNGAGSRWANRSRQQQNAVAGGIVNGSFTMPDNPINKLRLPHIGGGQSKTGAERGDNALQAALAAREGGRQAQPQARDRTNEARKAVDRGRRGSEHSVPAPEPTARAGSIAADRTTQPGHPPAVARWLRAQTRSSARCRPVWRGPRDRGPTRSRD